MSAKHFKDLRQTILSEGLEIVKEGRGSKHRYFEVRKPGTSKIHRLTVSCSPSDHRSSKNMRAEARRIASGRKDTGQCATP